MNIGVFDSGFGGLSILKDIVVANPQYDYVYLGDTARVPYGSRSREIVYQFTKEAVDFLFAHECGLVILACNTASAEALRRLQQEYLPVAHPDKRVLGVVVPALEEASATTKNEKVGILATEGTVASQTFVIEMKKHNPAIEVFQSAAPLLVPIVEAGEEQSEVAWIMVRQYLAPLLKNEVDTIILACTHYGHLEDMIKAECGPGVTVISEGPVVARKLTGYLARHPEIESTLSKNAGRAFYTTDLSDKFKTLGSRFFGAPIEPEQVEIA